MEAIAAIALIAVSAICKAVQDTLAHHYSTSIFAKWNGDFWNPETSWQNKYQNGIPAHGPRFFGSTTFLVALTDGWHLAGLFRHASILAAVMLYEPFFGWWDYPGLYLIFTGVFSVFYSKVFRSK